MQPIQRLFASVRIHCAALLALVWISRFEREHAQHLAQPASHNHFAPRELVARLQTVLRRRKANGNGVTTTAPSATRAVCN